MKALERKLLRDLVRLRGQVLSIGLVVATGVTAAVTMAGTLAALTTARDAYYRSERMPDVFASLTRAPESVADRLAAIPGVADVRTRVVLGLNLTLPGSDRPGRGLMVSVPDTPGPMLAGLRIVAGRWVAPRADDEVLVSERFAAANALVPGDTLGAVVNGRYRRLRIAGTAISPEYVYEIEPASGFMTDGRFGVLWMAREALAAASDMTGGFNDVVIALAPGASEDAVIAAVDAILERHGGRGAYGRRDQISNRIVEDEIAQNRGTATTVPVVFLAVAAFLLHIVLLRLVATERDAIGTLKAFGYGDARIALHYLSLAMAAVLLGALTGLVSGAWLGGAYTGLYGRYFDFPDLRFRLQPGIAAGAIATSGLAALGGALAAVRAAARLQPADAMRPESPAVFRPLLLERVGLHRWLRPADRMILRNVERRPIRTLISAVGVGAGLAVLLIGFVLFDSIRTMVDRQFTVIQREDAAVTFIEPRGSRAVRAVRDLPGVVTAEPFRMVPVRLVSQHRARRLALTGLEPDGTLRVMTGAAGEVHALPESGAVLSDRLARILRVGPGDTLRAELLDRGGAARSVVVAATIHEMIGMNAYVSMAELGRITREAPRADGVYLRLERGAEADIMTRLGQWPGVAAMTSKAAMVRSFDEQMAESLRVTTGVLLALASILAVGVIYNGARIALSERGRELASLRVLGFTRAEVARLLLGEQAVITALGLPIGAAAGAALSAAILRAFDTELYRMPVVFEVRSLLTSALVISAVAALAGLLVRRRLDRADLIAVLKTRE